jgi:hypothetical protein
MMKLITLMLFCVIAVSAAAQKTPVKDHSPWPYIANAKLQYSWGELYKNYCDKTFQADVAQNGNHQLSIWATLVAGEILELWVDGLYSGINFTGTGRGWERYAANLYMKGGLQLITFRKAGFMVPLAENLELEKISDFRTGLLPASTGKHPASVPATVQTADNARLLPNPAGNYEHDIETNFAYTTWAWVYLNKGSQYVFVTRSTQNADPVLHLFHPAAMSTMSWINDNASSTTRESRIAIIAPATGFYILMIRATKSLTAGSNAYTDMYCNNTLLVQKAVIGGNLFKNNIGGTTDSLNFFTCRLNHPRADTRLLLMNGQNFTANFYNDDYGSNGGDWQWGFSSRINSAWPAGNKPNLTFVCSYSPFTEGVADTYMGNRNSVAWTFFANWKKDDCIQAGVGYPLQPNPYYYNCIGWSGGLTNGFYWPGSYFSSWTVYGNDLASFDNYYSNNPARYPGAYTYTRTGATWSNAVVDLWATTNGGTGLFYTHGSVQKPGNDHPHGYDWESKPGSVERSFHPRLGPAGETVANYGSPVNHYIHTGTFARMAGASQAYRSAEEAVQAGVAVYDNPKLSDKASAKLEAWVAGASAAAKTAFDKLYGGWKSTWAANAVQSNPAMYCRNAEYKKLENWCREHAAEALPLLCQRYVNGDFLSETPLCAIGLPKYLYLLEEVKQEYKNNLYNTESKFRIRNDYGNGICFIEKLLMQALLAEALPAAEIVLLTVQPNPVNSTGIVMLTLKQPAKVSITAMAAQSGNSIVLQPLTSLAAGTYRFPLNIRKLGVLPGQLITVTAMVNGTATTVKVLAGQ